MTSALSQFRDRAVRTPLDLLELWRALMGEGGFGRRSLWLIFLNADGLPVPTIVPIDDIPVRADADTVDSLRAMLDHLIDAETPGSVAMLVSRPGPALMNADDCSWARALSPLTPWPVHLATTDQVRAFAPDDLVAA